MSDSDTNRLPDGATLARRIAQATPAIDHAAEAELCRQLARRVRLYGLRHLRTPAAADDLMQQVMVMLIERLRAGALRDPAQLVSFVFGICRMVVLDLRRGTARRERLLEIYGDALAPAETLAPNLDSARLADCLERLPERERTILLLTFYDDMPADTLARELDLTPGNVRVIRHRGLERLRGCVTGENA
jgi:RNA polymerase sigma-70 factor (ECF subfamily)